MNSAHSRGTNHSPQSGPSWIVGPVRVVALIVVLPFRLAYELLKAIGRAFGWVGDLLYRWLLAPIGRFFAAIGRAVYRYVLTPIGHVLDLLLLQPFLWLMRGVGLVLGWLLTLLIVIPATFLWRYVLRPPWLALVWAGRVVGEAIAWAWGWTARGLAWTGRVFIVIPARALWRYLLAPTGRAIAWVLRPFTITVRAAWRTLRQAGRDIRAFFRFS